MPVITGICEDQNHAVVVVDALRLAGFVRPAPEIIAGDPDVVRHAVPASLRELLLGSTAGTCLGGLIGGLAGWVVDATELALAFVLALPGLAVGATTGALLGTHAGGSVAVFAADEYAARIARGAALVRIDAPHGAMARRAMKILRAYGVQGIRSGAVR
jgi:hypothetical protein